MVDVWLPYGDTEVCLRVKMRNLNAVLKPDEKPMINNLKAKIGEALREPVGTDPLSEMAKPGERVAIAVKCPMPGDCEVMGVILKVIIHELNSSGVKPEGVRVIATYDPLHTNWPSYLKRMIQECDELKEMKVIIHNPDGKNNIHVGKTAQGTKIDLNRAFVEADLKVTAGFIRPHPYAGYAGGGDVILPGVSGKKTIQQYHSKVFHPKAVRGLLDENPMYIDSMEASKLAGVNFAVDVIRDHRGDVVGVFAGELERSFKEGVGLLDSACRVHVKKGADVLFLSPGGKPFDSNLYETCLGLDIAPGILGRNGALVLVGECREGYGDQEFFNLVKSSKGFKEVERALRRRFTGGRYVAHILTEALRRFRVILVSALPDYYTVEAFKLRPSRTVNEALRFALDITGRDADIMAVTHGRYVIPTQG